MKALLSLSALLLMGCTEQKTVAPPVVKEAPPSPYGTAIFFRATNEVRVDYAGKHNSLFEVRTLTYREAWQTCLLEGFDDFNVVSEKTTEHFIDSEVPYIAHEIHLTVQCVEGLPPLTKSSYPNNPKAKR
jgi:hypothetical protein